MDKGLFFSADAAAYVFIMLVILGLALQHTAAETGKLSEKMAWYEKTLFADSLVEAIVKNRSAEKPWLGAAYYNSGFHRVESNVIDGKLLESITRKDFGKFMLSAIYEKNHEGIAYLFNANGKNCAASERFVIVKGAEEKKEILGVVVCENL